MFGRQIFALLGVCALLFCCEKENASPKKERSIVVVYENDVHCQGEGYAKFAAVRDAVRDTADVLTVTSGDFLQGSSKKVIHTDILTTLENLQRDGLLWMIPEILFGT